MRKELEREMSSAKLPPPCLFCKHFNSEAFDKSARHRGCEAFGDKGIPNEIWVKEVDHRKPYEGDNGIQFEYFEDASKLHWIFKDTPMENLKKVYEMVISSFENLEPDDE